MVQWLKSLCTTSHAHSRGVAALEFALVAPVLILLILGSFNLTQMITMKRKVAAATELAADLVARHDTEIASTSIDDYFIAVELALRPIDITQVRIDIYDFSRDAGNIETRWRKNSANGEACTPQNPNINDPIGQLTADGRDVVVAVLCMPFQAIGATFPGLEFFAGKTLEKRVAMRPRQSLTLTCTPAACP